MALGNELTGRVIRSLGELKLLGLADVESLAVWSSPRWWQFVEDDETHEVCYLAITDEAGILRSVAPAIIARGTENLLFYNAPQIIGNFTAIGSLGLLDAAERDLLGTLEPTVLESRGSLYPSLSVATFGSDFGLRSGGGDSDFDLDMLVPATIRLAAEASLRWQFPTFCLLYLDDAENEAAQSVVATLNLEKALFGAEAVLDVPPGGIEAYVAGLSKPRRNSTRREMRQFQASGYRTIVREGPDALTEDHVPLRAALRAKYGHSAEADWVRREFNVLRSTMGDSLLVLTALNAQERVVGCLIAFRKGQAIYTRAAGFDYEATQGSYCYFNVAYYELIRWCADRGIDRIHYGLGALDAKAARGCSLSPRWAYFALPDDSPAALRTVLQIQHRTALQLVTNITSHG